MNSISVTSVRDEVVKVLKVVLPKLADGFFRQRGHVFGFGDYDVDNPMLLLSKDMSRLNKAETRFIWISSLSY